MLQAEVWSTTEAVGTAQAQPKLVKTESPSAKVEIVPLKNITPDASLFLIPVCLIAVWTIVAFPFFREIAKTKSTGTNFLRMSRIPCRNCRFFSRSSYLKCAVHPTTAMTEDAVNCSDYCSNRNTTNDE
jgi:hypothetical protein